LNNPEAKDQKAIYTKNLYYYNSFLNFSPFKTDIETESFYLCNNPDAKKVIKVDPHSKMHLIGADQKYMGSRSPAELDRN